MNIDYNDPNCFCPYCDELLDENGYCPNWCEDDLEDYFLPEDDSFYENDLIYEDDFYDIIPGYDYILDEDDRDE
jgi:hypothetical protein